MATPRKQTKFDFFLKKKREATKSNDKPCSTISADVDAAEEEVRLVMVLFHPVTLYVVSL